MKSITSNIVTILIVKVVVELLVTWKGRTTTADVATMLYEFSKPYKFDKLFWPIGH